MFDSSAVLVWEGVYEEIDVAMVSEGVYEEIEGVYEEVNVAWRWFRKVCMRR